MQKLGILAGVGKLPVECAKAAKNLGYEVYSIALLPDTDSEIQQYSSKFESISVANLEKLLQYLEQNEIKLVTMIGKVTKELLFKAGIQPDQRAMQLIMSLTTLNDDAIMLAFIEELKKIGIETFDQTSLIKMLMPAAGVLTKRAPDPREEQDIEFGFQIAKELGRLDIGQTVVIKNRAVMALEAIEGTDACIKRGGDLSGGGAVVVKVAKPQQDSRFDVPTVGAKTIEVMNAAGASTLAIEADKTLLVEREKVLQLAESCNLAIVAR